MHSAALDQLIGKTIIIFGLGVEGRSTFEFVRSQLPEAPVFLVDDKPVEKLDAFWRQIADQPNVTLVTSSYQFASRDAQTSVLFKTPGIPAHHLAIQALLTQGAVLQSNTELFFELVATQQQAITIGVTGTKGKSTTTSLIHHLLKTAGFHTYLAGNIGTPALTAWQEWQQSDQSDPAYFILELSAHQLAELSYSPHIAIVQHIAPEHLDYYPAFEQYMDAKGGITRHQTAKDLVLYNIDSSTARQVADLSPGEKMRFSVEPGKGECFIENGQVVFHNHPIIPTSCVPLSGRHNLYNTMPAVMVGKLFDLSNETIAKGVSSFQALPHRLQLVGEVNGVSYYDDSIATTPEATMAALAAFADKHIVLLAGGYERHQDYHELAKAIVEANVRAVALFPPTGKRLQAELAQHATTLVTAEVTTMDEAVNFAHRQAQPGDVVLLSPAAASFGMFKDYQDRGNQFRDLVVKLPTDTPGSA